MLLPRFVDLIAIRHPHSIAMKLALVDVQLIHGVFRGYHFD